MIWLALAQSEAMDESLWARALEFAQLQGGYNATVVQLGTALLGIAAGSVGTFALLRKRSLMGDALAHATLPGICLAFLVAPLLGIGARSPSWLLLGAALFSVIGVLSVQAIAHGKRLTEDTAMAVVLSSFFGLGYVLLSYIQTLPSGNQAGLKYLILGQAATMRAGDAMVMSAVAVVALLALGLLFKELRTVCFDREFAAAQGWPVLRIDLALMALVVLVTVIGLQAVGIVLIVALLVVPPAAARLWSDRLAHVLVIAAAIGGISGYVGSILSALYPRLAAGGTIVLVAGSCFALSLLVSPRRGLIANMLRSALLRMRMARDHALRSIFEWLDAQEQDVASGAAVPLTALTSDRQAARWSDRLIARWLGLSGLVRTGNSSLTLTDKGAALATQITRGHRLWEQYLLSYADIAPSHVHSPADLVEHALNPDLIEELERALAQRGRHAPSSAPRSKML